ncbi:Mannan endo-1,4-beta-mannosidase 1 [Dendrobium catenatum]|uniref:Mannan endo-1,4-beta-mannosidase 1 n=1 Tax=Dendrobium catenatum TaxID=906689 RepID=A0A2I0XF71_9ASPA|nr:Mannan endo-1,4-beta-mannosidase 1 [Dendrobium catenatum]
MSAYVEIIDNNHLLEIGLEGFYDNSIADRKQFNPGNNGVCTDFISNNLVTGIDFATIHIYPEQWSTRSLAIQIAQDRREGFERKLVRESLGIQISVLAVLAFCGGKGLAVPVLDSSKVFNGGSKVLDGFNLNFKGFKENLLTINEGGLLGKKELPILVPGKGKDVVKVDCQRFSKVSPIPYESCLSSDPVSLNSQDASKVDKVLSLKRSNVIPEEGHKSILTDSTSEEYSQLHEKVVNEEMENEIANVVIIPEVIHNDVTEVDSAVVVYNKFGSLSNLEEEGSMMALDVDAGGGIEEGEILHSPVGDSFCFEDRSEKRQSGILMKMEKGQSLVNSNLVGSHSFEKKAKLIKELKSLCYGNIIPHSRKGESGKSKKAGGPSPIFKQ